MLSRLTRLTVVLFAAGLTGLGAQTPVQAHAYVDDFGVEAPIIAAPNSVLNPLIATYYGWEATTVFGHTIYAMTVDEYNADRQNNCFQFYAIYRAGCTNLLGASLFGKPLNPDPQNNYCPVPAKACFGDPYSVPFTWTPGTEIVFALRAHQGNELDQTPDYNWFFSGDPARNGPTDGDNGTGWAHLAYWPSGVGGNKGIGPPVPGTEGRALYGFEDTGWINSDWDFDNAIFSLNFTSPGVPQSLTPEPATMTLLAAGLTGLGVLGRRRRRTGRAA